MVDSIRDVRLKLPFQVSFKTRSSSSSYADLYNSYDVSIGGIPFLLKIDPNNPLVRGTAQFRKQQLDTSLEPGEQSLTGWWLRSQSSFHWGAGLKYGDPELDPTAPFRFHSSEGVDPWTEGQVTLLPKTSLLTAATGTVRVITALDSGVEKYYRVEGADVYQGTSAGVETLVYDGADTILDITTDGSDVYVSTVGDIMRIPNGSGTPVQAWDVTATNDVRIGWVKQRIVAVVDNKIYVPLFSSTTLPAAVYEHPNTDWTCTGIAEGPEAIYVAGGVGSESVIIRLTLDNTGAVPTLSSATVVAAFPTGELVTSIYSYLGTFLAIGTTKGVRIATITSGGGLQYGPLIDTPQPVRCVYARGDHVLAGYSQGFSDGDSGLLRVSLATIFDDGGFPYATDLQVHDDGDIDSIALLPTSDLLLIGVNGAGVYKEHATEVESTGWLRTASQRYNTVWPKLFKRFNVRGDFTGPMSVSTVDDNGTEINIVSLSANTDQTQDLAINYPDAPQEFLALKFTFNVSSEDATVGTVFRSYQLKALPGGPRPRQFTLPLLCFDYERDRNNARRGRTGYALERLQALEELDSSGDVVLFEELSENTGLLCTIEAMEFRQIEARGSNGSRWGGILTVVLRTLSA